MPYSAPGGGSSVVLQAYRLVTSDEIKALFTTAIELVPAVADKAYCVIDAQIVVRYGGTAYSNVGGNLLIQTGTEYWISFPASNLGATANTIVANPQNASVQMALTFAENQNINIQDDTQNPTLGNGTLEVWVWYVPTDV